MNVLTCDPFHLDEVRNLSSLPNEQDSASLVAMEHQATGLTGIILGQVVKKRNIR
jgi:hypothetical protein